MIVCPNCKKELSSVKVYSQCKQACDIDPTGVIQNWGQIEEVFTQAVECPHCATEIIDLIKE